MSIITITDFGAERSIAQTSNIGVQENLQSFIDKYEPIFLKKLFGSVMANEFIAGLAVEPIEQRWIDLRNKAELKTMLVDYVYYWYTRNQVTFTAGTGEVKGKNVNSVAVSSTDKQVSAWNEMAELARNFTLDVEVYPNWINVWYRYYSFRTCGQEDIFLFINTLNI